MSRLYPGGLVHRRNDGRIEQGNSLIDVLDNIEQYLLRQASTELWAKTFPLDYPPFVANVGYWVARCTLIGQWSEDSSETMKTWINAPDHGYVQYIRAGVGPRWITGRPNRAHDRYPSRLSVPV